MFSSFLLPVFILVILSSSSLLVSGDLTCAGTASNGGGYYDLSALQGKSMTGSAQQGYAFQYALNMCSIVTSAACSGKNAMMCQMDNQGNFNAVDGYGSNDAQGQPSWKQIDPTNPQKGVILTVTGASDCVNPRHTIITIQCDATKTAPPTTFTVLEQPTCQNNIVITHASGCPTTPPSGGGGDGKSKKLSGGSVFVIIFFVSAFVYVVAGCAYKRTKLGTSGVMESCPNNEFWVSIPGLVKDGFKFFIAKCRSLCDNGGSGGGGKTSYESI